jgi:hypothetical protein
MADTGGVFQQRGGGFSYGWRCALSSVNLVDATAAGDTPTVNTTYLSNLHQATCADGSQNAWEVQVPNGVCVNNHFSVCFPFSLFTTTIECGATP